MKNVLRAFQIISQDGMKTINTTYNSLDDSGNLVAKNKSDSFYAIDEELVSHIEAIERYIKENRLTQ